MLISSHEHSLVWRAKAHKPIKERGLTTPPLSELRCLLLFLRSFVVRELSFGTTNIGRTREKKAGNWEIMQFVGRLFNTQRASVVVMRS